MRNITSILVTTICMLLLFSTVVYTSCSKERDECMYMVCYNGDTCTNGICTCPTGYESKNCETKSDPCKNVVCLNGGACGLGGQCFCPYGYAGQRCEIRKCDTANCLNGATCQDGNCVCADGYEGIHCESAIREKFFGDWKTMQSLYPALTNGETTMTINNGGSGYAGSAHVTAWSSTGTPLFGFTANVSPEGLYHSFGEVSVSGGYALTKLLLKLNGDTLQFSYSYYDKLSPEKGNNTAYFTRK